MPGMFAKITNIVCQEENPHLENELVPVMQTVRQFRKSLMEWSSTYDSHILTHEGKHKTQALDDKLVELFGTSLLLRVIAARLLGTISPPERSILEDEALCFAKQVITLERAVSSVNKRASFYLAQKARIGNATLLTAGLWEDTQSSNGKVIEKWKFERWCALIPRKTSSNGYNCDLSNVMSRESDQCRC
jgi:hypothetical protein